MRHPNKSPVLILFTPQLLCACACYPTPVLPKIHLQNCSVIHVQVELSTQNKPMENTLCTMNTYMYMYIRRLFCVCISESALEVVHKINNRVCIYSTVVDYSPPLFLFLPPLLYCSLHLFPSSPHTHRRHI